MIVLKILLKALASLVIIILMLLSVLYWHSQFYIFQSPEPFKGLKIYNPYHNISNDSLYKANFHAHSQAWAGFTNGHNSPDELYRAYKAKGYHIASISNYHQLRSESDIPIYEHGFNIRKSHKLALFTPEVSYIDFPFSQNTSHKQTIIDLLKNKGAKVAIAHPKFWQSHHVEEFEVLDNYEFIEVLNHYDISDKHWDRALSTGHPVWLLANDDTHDLVNEPSFVMWTMIFSESPSLASIKKNMLKGRHYGVHGKDATSTNQLLKAEVENSTISLIFREPYTNVLLIGQNGQIHKEASEQDYIDYKFREDDSYIRAVVYNQDGSVFYLNPFIRYDGLQLRELVRHNTIDTFKTYSFRTLLVLVNISMAFSLMKILKI